MSGASRRRYPPLLQPISTVSDSVAPPFPVLPANDCVGANRQATAAAEMQVSGSHYTLAGGRSGTAGLTPAQIVEKAEAARERGSERGLTRGRATQVPAPIASRFLLCLTVLSKPFFCCVHMALWVEIKPRRPQCWGCNK